VATEVPAVVIIIVGATAVAVLIAVPILVLATAFRSPSPSKLPTILALVLWGLASVVLAGVWFFVVVAAHKTDAMLTATWIIANGTYPVAGIGIALAHRRLLS
jgi:hypothetical protein